MPDSTVRSDSVNVEQIMEQIRARIRDRRGVDYSEQQVRDLAATKLDKLLEQFRRSKPPEQPPNYTFDSDTLFESRIGLVRAIRRLLRPLLRLFFNPNAVADALHMQAQLNARQAQLEASRHMLYDELIHNLVIEAARLGLEAKSLKMRVESLSSRLEFSERRVRTLESSTIYKPSAEDRQTPQTLTAVVAMVSAPPSLPPSSPPQLSPTQPSGPASTSPFIPSAQPMTQGARPAGSGPSGAPDQRRRRRRRRRGRRGSGPGGVNVGSPSGAGSPADATPGAFQPGQESANAAGHEANFDESAAEVFADDGGPDAEGPSTTDSGPGDSGDPENGDR